MLFDVYCYRDIVYFSFADYSNYILFALPLSELPTAGWSDLVQIGSVAPEGSQGNDITGTAMCASGDFLFVAYSSLDARNEIVTYHLDDEIDQIVIDNIWTAPDDGTYPRPVYGLHTDGNYLFMVVGDNYYNTDNGEYGGIDIFSINEAF